MDCKMNECNSGMASRDVLAMATVSWQKWREVMDGKCGLAKGTIFEELSLPFYGVKAACDPSFNRERACDACTGSPHSHRMPRSDAYGVSSECKRYGQNNAGMGRRCDCR